MWSTWCWYLEDFTTKADIVMRLTRPFTADVFFACINTSLLTSMMNGGTTEKQALVFYMYHVSLQFFLSVHSFTPILPISGNFILSDIFYPEMDRPGGGGVPYAWLTPPFSRFMFKTP
jgi:hypothetical protein